MNNGNSATTGKDVRVRMPNIGVVVIPLAWLRGEFVDGTFTISRRKVRLRDESVNDPVLSRETDIR